MGVHERMVTIKNDVLEVGIDELGAQLRSMRSLETGIEYLWQRDTTYWGKTAPNLFPFVGRLYDKRYTYNGKSYDMGIHGFLPQSVLTPVDVTESAVTFELTESEETLAIWPFRFVLHMCYELKGPQLNITMELTNRSKETLYYGNGGHPGFNIPLEEGIPFTDYQIEFPEAFDARQVVFDDGVLDTGERIPYELKEGRILPLRHNLFDHDAVVFEDMPREVTIRSDKGTHGVTVSFPAMRYVGFWHKVESDAPYVCVEPWSVLPGRSNTVEDLETMPGLTPVAPGETSVNPWSIRVF